MHSGKKQRVDFSGDSAPLSDNPFASLNTLPGVPSPEAAPPEPAKPVISKETPETKPLFRVAKTRKGGYPIFLEKRAAGKMVTVIRNISGDADGLLRFLRKKCGAGGVVRDGEVELQGDHRAKVEALLKES